MKKIIIENESISNDEKRNNKTIFENITSDIRIKLDGCHVTLDFDVDLFKTQGGDHNE